MADQPNVFGDGTPTPAAPAAPAATTNPNDAFATMLGTIKNEQGSQKYDSVEKALEALKHSQEYIPSLKSELEKKENELAELRASKARFENLEAVVERLTATKPNGEEPPATKGLDEQAVNELVRRTLAETESSRKASDNLNKVQEALVGKYKDKAAEVVQAKATELGVTKKDLEELAKKSPALALQLFNTKVGESPSATTSSFSSQLSPHEAPKVTRPEKSLLSGAKTADVADFFAKVKEEVYRQNGIS